MPVVDSMMSFLRCPIIVRRIAMLLMASALSGSACLAAQEAAAPVQESPSIEAIESAPAAPESPAAAEDATAPPAEAPPAAINPPPVAPPAGTSQDEYLAAILKQQKWTREIAAIRNPLFPDPAKAEEDFVKNVQRNYRTLLTTGPNLNNANDLQTMRKGLEFRILRASDPAVQESPRLMQGVVNDIRRELKSVGNQINNPQTKEQFRRDVMKEAHAVLLKLLDNSLDARTFAINLLIELETVPASFEQKRIVIYEEVVNTLARLLNDETQPDSVRASVANAIRIYLQKTDTFPVDQMKLAKALSSELGRINTEYTYQLLLVDALTAITEPREIVGRPVPTVFEALKNVIGDRNRFLNVRCRAAKGLGRIGYDTQINYDVLAWKVAQLAAEAGQYFNQSPGNPGFQQCGVDLYLAFHHATAAEQSGPKPKGMLNRAPRSQFVKDAYAQVLKVAGPMIFTSKPVAQADLASVSEWVSQNQPSSLAYDASGVGTPVSK
jgi:hypothetical protein